MTCTAVGAIELLKFTVADTLTVWCMDVEGVIAVEQLMYTVVVGQTNELKCCVIVEVEFNDDVDDIEAFVCIDIVDTRKAVEFIATPAVLEFKTSFVEAT